MLSVEANDANGCVYRDRNCCLNAESFFVSDRKIRLG